MCGVVGYVGEAQDGLLERMIDAVRSRGPDDEQKLILGRTHLGFTRLAINDLGFTGNQPMKSRSGRFISVMNGELYNAPEIRYTLQRKGFEFRGSSDAEIMPHGFEYWGTELFAKLRGMFAVAVWDCESESLYLARDQFGIKPLYYSTIKDGLVFGSSSRAVAKHPRVGTSLRESAIAEVLRFRYCPSGESMFEAVATVNPGEWIRWDRRGLRHNIYWQRQPYEEDDSVHDDEWPELFADALQQSIQKGMLSDVPMGILLSGGIDSGAVAHFAGQLNARNVLAFTYAMPGKHDESSMAREIATNSGIDHRVVQSANESFHDSFVGAIRSMDTPVLDAIIVPTFNLLKAVSGERKVVLTGEGADELLGGYAHIKPLLMLGSMARHGVPLAPLAGVLKTVPTSVLNRFFPYEASLGSQGHRKLCQMVSSGRSPGLALDYATSIFSVDEIQAGTVLNDFGKTSDVRQLAIADLMNWGFSQWLPNQILNKMDQLSMAHGVEARVPYVDPVVYDIVRRVPRRLLVSGKSNKVLLRTALQRRGYRWPQVPKRAFFVPPTSAHLADLSTVADEWSSQTVLAKYGIVSAKMVKAAREGMNRGDFLATKQVAAIAGLHIWLDQGFAW